MDKKIFGSFYDTLLRSYEFELHGIAAETAANNSNSSCSGTRDEISAAEMPTGRDESR